MKSPDCLLSVQSIWPDGSAVRSLRPTPAFASVSADALLNDCNRRATPNTRLHRRRHRMRYRFEILLLEETIGPSGKNWSRRRGTIERRLPVCFRVQDPNELADTFVAHLRGSTD